VRTALNDPRPLRPDAAHQNVRATKRELRHTLDQLERAVATAADPSRAGDAAFRTPFCLAPAAPWPTGNLRAGRANASSRPVSRYSTASASRTSRPRISPTR
jgi:hypothetical protein